MKRRALKQLLAQGRHTDDVDAGALGKRSQQVVPRRQRRGNDGAGRNVETHRRQLALVCLRRRHRVVGRQHHRALAQGQRVEQLPDARQHLGAPVEDAIHVEDPGLRLSQPAQGVAGERRRGNGLGHVSHGQWSLLSPPLAVQWTSRPASPRRARGLWPSPIACPSASLNCGRSPGTREVMRLPSMTSGSST